MWPYVGCALDTSLKRRAASRLARTDQTDFVASCTSSVVGFARAEPGGTCRDDRHEPRSAALRRGCRANVPAAGAGDDAARGGVHGLRRSSSGSVPTSSAAAGSAPATSSRSARAASYLTVDVGRRERARGRRRRRAAARVPEHLPAPRRAAASTRPRARCGGSSAPTTRGRYGFDGACKNAPFTDGLATSTRSASRCTRCASRSSRASCCSTSSGEAPPPQEHIGDLAPLLARYRLRRAAARRADRLRRRRQLEGDRRELQRVPALPGRAPGAQPALALPQRRDDRGRRRVVRRLDDARRGRRDDGRRRRGARPQADRRASTCARSCTS